MNTQRYEIAAAKLAVGRQIEWSEITGPASQLQTESNPQDLLELQRRFLVE